jgi:hypothetical protein
MKNIHTKSLFVVLFAVLFAFGPSMAEAKFSLSTKNTAAARGGVSAKDSRIPTTPTTPVCATPIYARIVFANGQNGSRNWGTGNTSKNVYVGGSAATDKYTDGQWFMLTDGKTVKIDPDLTNTYEDVPGVAVQRLANAVRIVLHGDWDQPSGHPLTNVERNQGTLEFSTDGKTVSRTIVPVAIKSDPKHKVENGENHGDANTPGDDWIKIEGATSQFKFVVNTNNDGYYTSYKNTNTNCKK